MKIRLDFVTNSSSSSFVTIGILSKELSEFLKEYITDYANKIFSPKYVAELRIDGYVVNYDGVISAANMFPDLHINRLLDEDDYGIREQQANDDKSISDNYSFILKLILACLPELSEPKGKELAKIIKSASEEHRVAIRSYMAMTDSIRDSKFFSRADIINSNIRINYDSTLFEIEKGCLKKYKGKASIVDVPEGVLTINEYSLKKACIKTINIPKSVVEIAEHFSGDNLKCINVDPENKCFSSIDGVLFNKDATELLRFPPKYPSSSYVTPKSVIRICGNSFYGCKDLTSLTLSENVEYVSYSAFSSCPNISDFHLLNENFKIDKSFLPQINL